MQRFFRPKIYLGTKYFSEQIFFQTQNFSDSKWTSMKIIFDLSLLECKKVKFCSRNYITFDKNKPLSLSLNFTWIVNIPNKFCEYIT